MKITLKVVPRSAHQKIIIDKTGTLKCYLNSPPEDGKANKELIQLLAKQLKTTQRDIQILQGITSRTKTVEFAGFSDQKELLEALGLQIQQSLLL